jgi:TonB family protein
MKIFQQAMLNSKKYSGFSWFAGFSFLLHLALVVYVMKESPGHQSDGDFHHVQVEILDLQKYIVIPQKNPSNLNSKSFSKPRTIPAIKEEEILSSLDQNKDVPVSATVDEQKAKEDIFKTRESVESSYQQKLQSLIEQKKYYPLMSYEMKESGQVTILFSLKQDGSIDQIYVDQASKYERLNRAALKAVQQAAPFDSPPEWRKTFVVTLHFILEG